MVAIKKDGTLRVHGSVSRGGYRDHPCSGVQPVTDTRTGRLGIVITPKGPQPAPVEVRRRKLMTHDRELYEYITALVAARELDRAGGDASGALDGHGAANRVWSLSAMWAGRRDALSAMSEAARSGRANDDR